MEQVLAEYHKANPLHAGMKVAALRQKALRGAELKEADAILTAMLRGGTVTAIADRCALPDFRVVLTKRQTALRQKLLDSYRKSGREVPFVDDIYASFPTNERDDCKKVLENLVSCGELVMLTPQLFYHKDVYEEVCALTRDFFEGHPAFTLAEYRDLLGNLPEICAGHSGIFRQDQGDQNGGRPPGGHRKPVSGGKADKFRPRGSDFPILRRIYRKSLILPRDLC